MGLKIKKARDGQPRPFWYCQYTDRTGKMIEERLDVPIKGEPPPGLDLDCKGDYDFERSRGKALNEFQTKRNKARGERMDKATAAKEYKRMTGSSIKETPLMDIPKIITHYDKRKRTSDVWASWKQKVVTDFLEWSSKKNLYTAFEVSTDHAKEYLDGLYTPGKKGTVSATTARRVKAILGLAFELALPEGAFNPWRAADVSIDAAKNDKEVHRTPLSNDEVIKILEASKHDTLTHGLIVCALSTGLRRGDVCRLKWSCVDMKENSLELTTEKTGTSLFLPILPLFKRVLEARLANRRDKDVYVFPEAERLIRENPDGITWRIKKAFAVAFADNEEDATEEPQEAPELVKLPDVLPRVVEAISKASLPERKRVKMLEIVKRYSEGETYRGIEHGLKVSRGSISGLLHEAEELSKLSFLHDRRKMFSMKRAVATITREERTVGKRSASLYDFHALRTTFVTIAISNGFSIDKLRALTGHATVEIVLKHYFKPKGTDFSNELEKAMPESLTGTPRMLQIEADQAPMNPVDQIAQLMGKLSRTQKKELSRKLNQKARSK